MIESKENGAYIILIPSGKCPHLLEGTDVSSVRDWVEKVKASRRRGSGYAKSVYAYWIRDSYDINSADYKAALNNLDSVIKD